MAYGDFKEIQHLTTSPIKKNGDEKKKTFPVPEESGEITDTTTLNPLSRQTYRWHGLPPYVAAEKKGFNPVTGKEYKTDD